jgi:copper transport protein
MRRALVLAACVASILVAPAGAWAHAVLLRTVPAASRLVNTPPRSVALVYSEAVEPRFAVVSVTDAAGRQQASGPPQRSAVDVDELDVPLRPLREGWYLVFWRAISADGHPVRGAFTFAVGPNPGPAPAFVIPSLSETAATPTLVAARFASFLGLLAAIGLFAFRLAITRPLRGPPRALSVAFWLALGVALVAVPVYVLLATAQFALRHAWALGALVPLLRTSAFGRGYLDLELLLLLFAVAAAVALWLERPRRAQRSVAELLALGGAVLAGSAALLAPGAAGHAAQTSPRALALSLDWLHLAAGSVWLGGLVGLLVLAWSLPASQRLAGLAVCVPCFSNMALVSVVALLGSGVGAAVLHLPTLATLWETSYGQTIIVKASLLLAAIVLASVNLLRARPALAGADPSPHAAVLLWRLAGGEVLLVAGAVCAAAVLSSLPPPPKALAGLGSASATVGPGPVTSVVDEHGYRLELRVSPNRVAVPNDFAVRITRRGTAVRGARVTATLTMLDMEMPEQSYALAESSPGLYRRASPALVMVGHWGLSFEIAPPGVAPFTVLLVDRAAG